MDATVLCTSTLASSFTLFLIMYLLAYLVLFRNWDLKLRKEASSSFMSFTHGTPAVIFAIQSLVHTPKTSLAFASPNSNLHDRVLEFSMAYFMMDLAHYLIFFPNGILFILHHLATLYVFATCRYMVCHGAYEILVLLILAEVTSPCQNVRTIASLRRADNPTAARLFKILSTPFLVFYTVVRGILGPVFACKMGMFYSSGQALGLTPGWAWISWMVVIVTAILISILWISNQWTCWLRERNLIARKKVS